MKSGLNHNQKMISIQIILPILVVAITVIIALSFIRGKSSQKQTSALYNDQRTQAPLVKAKQKINKTFSFPLKNAKGVEINKIDYIIESAELQDEIIVKGQRATAVKGKTFLILNLRIRNDNKQVIEVNTRDYIRLTINDNNEQFAADIHNDPVLIQAISTKPTRLGFPIKDTDKKIILHVGEIEGGKKTININFK